MRSDIVLDLIKSHYDKDDFKFEKTVKQIIKEESKKGNIKLVERIESIKMELQDGDNIEKVIPDNNNQPRFSYGPSSGLVMKNRDTYKVISPKDKSSQNDLFDLTYPEEIKDEKIILSAEIHKKLDEIINEFKKKEMLKEFDLKVENRLLLCGPPGCGKTTTAFLVASLLNLPLAYVRLDSLVTSLLGQTGTNIRRVFEAVNDQNIILFIDEFDAIAKRRDDNNELGELKRVVNTLLQNIDMLPDNVFLIAATNHQNLLDDAVWRRFNSVLYLDLPDENIRARYINKYLSTYEKIINIDLNTKKFSKLCKGMSFASIQEVLSKTIKKKLIHDKKNEVSTRDFTEVLLNAIFLYNKGNNIDIEKLKELRENGLSLRDLSDMTSIPRSTLSDWINK